MPSIGLLLAGGVVAVFTFHSWRRAYQIAREDAKQAKALRLADEYPPFARALGTVFQLGASLPGSSPWHRPETSGPRGIIVLRRGA